MAVNRWKNLDFEPPSSRPCEGETGRQSEGEARSWGDAGKTGPADARTPERLTLRYPNARMPGRLNV